MIIRLFQIFLICFCFVGCSTDQSNETDELLEELARINNQLTVLQISALTKLNNQNSVAEIEKLKKEIHKELEIISNQLATVEQLNNPDEWSKRQEQREELEELENQTNATEIKKLKKEIAELKAQLEFQEPSPATQPLPDKHNFTVSRYGRGNQIWFEVEDYTEMSPEGNEHWTTEKIDKAFGGTVLSPTGKFGTMLRYEFDISACGDSAKGGEWYFWARLVNPNNLSEFLLVKGHEGDTIPAEAPADRGPFNNKQRIFEESMGALPDKFAWGLVSHKEGHTKTLQDGKNIMVILRRQGGPKNKMDVFMWTDDKAYQPTDEDYEKARALQ